MAYFNPLQSYFSPAHMADVRQDLLMPPMAQAPMPPQNQGMPLAPPMPNQGQVMPEESPVSRGIASGMNAGSQRIFDIDQAQHDRLMGLAIAKMFGGMGQGGGSVLGGLNQGLAGGIDAYHNERANLAKMNALEVERQDRLAKEAQLQKEREQERRDLQAHRAATLALRKESLPGKYGESKAGNIDIEDAVPLSSMPKNAASSAIKEMQGVVNTGSSWKAVLTTLDQMKELSDANPHLGNSMAVAYYASRDGKGLENVLKNVALGKDRAAVEKFSKLSSRLVQHQIKSVKGPATDRLKQIIMQSTPQAGQTKEAIDYLIDTAREEAMPNYENVLRAREGLRKGLYTLPKLEPYKPDENVNPAESLSIEELRRIAGE